MIHIANIIELQTKMVDRWHRQEIDNPYQGFLQTVCQQLSFNYLLWHAEDIARSPDVGDAEIARVKRSIDRFNQQRNDWIETVDDEITKMLQEEGVATESDAPLNTETPGSAIDRLAIMALRYTIYESSLNVKMSTTNTANLFGRKLRSACYSKRIWETPCSN